MVNNPNLYNPYTHSQAATDRRQQVIQAMVADGALSASDGAAAWPRRSGCVRRPGGAGGTCMAAAPDAGFFCQYAVSYLEQAGFTADQLATGGYTIRTTMDPAASQAAKAAAEHNVPTAQDGVANTFALVQPGRDGHQVLAMVANRNYGTDAGRGERAADIVAAPSNVFGAGSSFKIFTTAAALENGTVGYDTPLPDPASDCFAPPAAHHNPALLLAHTTTPTTGTDQPAGALSTSPTSRSSPGGADRPAAVVQMAQRLGCETLQSNDAGSAPVTDPADPRSTDPQYTPQSSYFRDLLSSPGRQPG